MSEYKLSKECALPWNLDVRSKTYMAIRNANNNPTGLVLMCTGTPSQKAAADYAVACANLMPEAVELLDDAQNIMKWTCELCDGEACGRCGGCDVKGIGSRIAALLAKLEGGMGE